MSGANYFHQTDGKEDDCNVKGCDGGKAGACATAMLKNGTILSWCCDASAGYCWSRMLPTCYAHINNLVVENDSPETQIICRALNSSPYNWCCNSEWEICPTRPVDRDGMCIANFTSPVRLGIVADIPDSIVFAPYTSYPSPMSVPKGLDSGGPPTTTSLVVADSFSSYTQEPGLAIPTLPNTPTATATTTVMTDSITLPLAKSPTLPLGAAMGIGAAIVVVVTIALVAVYLLWKRSIRNGRTGPAPPQPVEMMTDCATQPPAEMDAEYEVLATHEIEGQGIHELATGESIKKEVN